MSADKFIWVSRSEVERKEYAEHVVFKELQEYIDFYDYFSMSIMGFPTMGTGSLIINIDTYFYSSIQGTLESLKHVLKNGRIGDAYALLRKYYDSAVLNIYINLYLEDNHSIENFIVQEITNWIQGTEKIPEYRAIMQYIKGSERLKLISELLYKDDTYRKIKERCNDHIHYNFFQNVIINDKQVQPLNRLALLEAIMGDIKNIFVLHLSYIFYLKDRYMCSSDYLDALEVGITLEENSQYWVAPFIQSTFSNIIVKQRPDIAQVIIENTCMYLMEKS
ncbi:hypothetical protein RFI_22082 [Reticulomyxa filosa]|uniref:Uncharacterized protein n=1 Tax=Reticulomyxa filosa TaxID=46433 RepID=X6MNP1_RETFI|nr:hypothetical protein RFI_22082 [Reticulomyxa filosa]|eukprot:ETO15281.1 hypothetical protein RFI_22082 [Reticulomyxa filosa]